MASNQPTKAIDVVPSDTINIPQPGSIVGGTSSTTGNTLTDASATFLNSSSNESGYNIRGGDVVIVNGEMAEVQTVDSDTVITLKSAISAVAGYSYKIYKGNGGDLKFGYNGYSLFVGTSGDVAVLPAGTGDDSVILKNVASNSYVPLQVQRVLSTGTTATHILGLE